MSNLDLAIAAQSTKVEYRKHRVQQRRDALRDGALNFCRKPGTLVGALVTGFVLAALYSPKRSEGSKHVHSGRIQAFLRQNFSASLKLLVVNALRSLFTPVQRTTEVEHSDLP